jgi:hypothetical protein
VDPDILLFGGFDVENFYGTLILGSPNPPTIFDAAKKTQSVRFSKDGNIIFQGTNNDKIYYHDFINNQASNPRSI